MRLWGGKLRLRSAFVWPDLCAATAVADCVAEVGRGGGIDDNERKPIDAVVFEAAVVGAGVESDAVDRATRPIGINGVAVGTRGIRGIIKPPRSPNRPSPNHSPASTDWWGRCRECPIRYRPWDRRRCPPDTRRPAVALSRPPPSHAMLRQIPPRRRRMDATNIAEAAALLVGDRRGRSRIPALPPSCRPTSVTEAHAIQDSFTAALGTAVGASGANAPAGAEPDARCDLRAVSSMHRRHAFRQRWCRSAAWRARSRSSSAPGCHRAPRRTHVTRSLPS